MVLSPGEQHGVGGGLRSLVLIKIIGLFSYLLGPCARCFTCLQTVVYFMTFCTVGLQVTPSQCLQFPAASLMPYKTL